MHTEMDQEFWDRRYAEHRRVWSGNPNPHLVTTASALPPGRALDVGCGEGADALWLARSGWRVTGVDISEVALGRAREQARLEDTAVAARVDWVHADLLEAPPEPGGFDLVSAQFMQLAEPARSALFSGLAEAVAPGGTLLIVGHHLSDLQTTVRRPPLPELFYTAEDLIPLLDGGWDITACEARPRSVADTEGHQATIHDTVLQARRHGPSHAQAPSAAGPV
ncbi:class I SAM-dependent methyltransferase [Arthrobacter crusticola]|uniref:Class I SAM-dependent methyltransferase n=1 Tax=Arthrobacter crusticola TaxID=2547960 RepID=A0A4R5TWS2_9MICC|nr:class I SAM-dependent methyltransferase [Arthrobacter crusticola]TDK25614.1 class I SAM-dependent methyltransferase [Arthrobacter crusticola]